MEVVHVGMYQLSQFSLACAFTPCRGWKGVACQVTSEGKECDLFVFFLQPHKKVDYLKKKKTFWRTLYFIKYFLSLPCWTVRQHTRCQPGCHCVLTPCFQLSAWWSWHKIALSDCTSSCEVLVMLWFAHLCVQTYLLPIFTFIFVLNLCSSEIKYMFQGPAP